VIVFIVVTNGAILTLEEGMRSDMVTLNDPPSIESTILPELSKV
jgi:hypothetical protein